MWKLLHAHVDGLDERRRERSSRPARCARTCTFVGGVLHRFATSSETCVQSLSQIYARHLPQRCKQCRGGWRTSEAKGEIERLTNHVAARMNSPLLCLRARLPGCAVPAEHTYNPSHNRRRTLLPSPGPHIARWVEHRLQPAVLQRCRWRR